jgi:two-component system cell cycle sensor histidine kinase/response regulator CckA
LRRHGYTVIEAADGVEALAILRRDPGAADLVLTDYMMPEMNGAALIRQLRSDGNGVKVAMSSGHAEFNQPPGAAGEKEVPMIAKPWTMEELVTAVREVLDGVR